MSDSLSLSLSPSPSHSCFLSLYIAGQFFHDNDGVKIDEDSQILHVPGRPPVPRLVEIHQAELSE